MNTITKRGRFNQINCYLNQINKINFKSNNVNDNKDKMETKPTLYYFYTSFYSQKVLMFLKEKEVDFQAHMVNLPDGETQSDWYLQINPRGEVPSLKVLSLESGERNINGSDNILQYLETNKIGNGKSLYPTDPEFLSKHNYFVERLNSLPIDAITFGTAFFPNIRRKKKLPIKWPFTKKLKSNILNRSETLRKKAKENSGTPAESVLLSKAEEHDKRIHLFTNEEEHKLLLREVQTILDEIEKELVSHKGYLWLINDEFSVADCILAILLNRLHFLGHEDYMASNVRPLLASWWGRVKDRKSFLESTKQPNIPFFILKSKLGCV